MNKQYKYVVALSFAEEDRNAALALALAFNAKNIPAYYYPDKKADTLGNLEERLASIYHYEAQYAVVLVSKHYVDPAKKYVQVELAAIRSRMNDDPDTVYMVPILLEKRGEGGADLMQHLPFDGQTYIEWNYEPEKIVTVIQEKLGKPRGEQSAGGQHTGSTIYNKNSSTNTIINTNNINIGK